MLHIYANSMQIATRTGSLPVRDVPPLTPAKRKRWFARKTRVLHPSDL